MRRTNDPDSGIARAAFAFLAVVPAFVQLDIPGLVSLSSGNLLILGAVGPGGVFVVTTIPPRQDQQAKAQAGGPPIERTDSLVGDPRNQT